MALFQDFKKATQAKAPDLVAAEIAEAQAEATALRERNQNVLGAGLLYNKGMGDKSPISDAIFGAETAAPITDTAFADSMATEEGLSNSLFGETGSMAGETALAEGGVNDALMGEILGGAGEVGTDLGIESALNMGAEGATTAALDASMLGADAALAGGVEAGLAGGAEAGLAGLAGTAGAAIPPVLMAAMLSRALGLWS